MATYVIGDIQGCFDSLQALLAQLRLQSDDRLWLCGDLVNRGPKSVDVLRWAMQQGDSLVSVLGNHDLHLLAASLGARKAKARDTFQDVLQADDCDVLLGWLQERPFLHRDGDYLLVHAGLHPTWSVALASELAAECERAVRANRWIDAWTGSRPTPPVWSSGLRGDARLASAMSVLVGVRTVYSDGRIDTKFAGPPQKRPAGSEPWYQSRDDDQTVIFGHWAALGLHLEDKHIGLDTGCVWGGALTAIRLEDRKRFTQPALEQRAGDSP
jgi:bis(5'-nucleosyl)-tetraphosphatase (symmetrical)